MLLFRILHFKREEVDLNNLVNYYLKRKRIAFLSFKKLILHGDLCEYHKPVFMEFVQANELLQTVFSCLKSVIN